MDDPDVHDSESILGIEAAPESILVIGGGASGCEGAALFARLGGKGTRVEAGSHPPPPVDFRMGRGLPDVFHSIWVLAMPMVSVSQVVRDGDALEARLADGRTLRVRKVLVAVGRRPQIEGLALAEAGVETDSGGWVQVDDRYSTSAPGVFAAGDVIGPFGL